MIENEPQSPGKKPKLSLPTGDDITMNSVEIPEPEPKGRRLQLSISTDDKDDPSIKIDEEPQSPGNRPRLSLVTDDDITMGQETPKPVAISLVPDEDDLLNPIEEEPQFLGNRPQLSLEADDDIPMDSAAIQNAPPKPPTVVGRDLNEREEAFVNSIQNAVEVAQEPSVPEEIRNGLMYRLQRGTYVVKEIDLQSRTILEESVEQGFFTTAANVGQTMAEYLGFDLTNQKHVEQTPIGFLVNGASTPIAIFKPGDEVRGAVNCMVRNERGGNLVAKHGISPEFEIPNETIAASLFNLSQPVVQMTLPGPFNYHDNNAVPKQGAAIGFLPSMVELTRAPDINSALNAMPDRDFQKMAIMDLALCNTDRNAGNAMINPNTGEAGLIDHALILPDQFRSAGLFAWMLGDKAHVPFNQESLNIIANLDYGRDSAKILEKYPDYPRGSLETMRITYYLLKKGAAAGLTPFQIGCFLTGDSNGFRLPPIKFMLESVQDLVQDKIAPQMDECIDDVDENLESQSPVSGPGMDKIAPRMEECIDDVIEKLRSQPVVIAPSMSKTNVKNATEDRIKDLIKANCTVIF